MKEQLKDMKLISVIVPCYNEQEVLPLYYAEMNKIISKMQTEHSDIEFELLFINDGSKDNTLKLLRELSKQDKRVRYISEKKLECTQVLKMQRVTML